MKDVIRHYDLLIEEHNDPVHDPKPLRDYMDKWDGAPFLERLRLDSAKSVLEIGVGTGRLARKVAPLCNSFCGIDISPKTVARARENLSDLSNVRLICDDFLEHRFDERFDVIYSSLTFMHISEKQQAVDKVASLLKENGVFVLSIDKSQDGYLDMGTRLIRLYPDDPEALKLAFARAGMTREETFETEFAFAFVCQKK